MSPFWLLLPLAFIFLYFIMQLWYLIAFARRKEYILEPAEKRPVKVSLVIPFRNEEESLPWIMQDLTAQETDGSNVEIIFVDDHSSDRSCSLVGEFDFTPGICKLIHLEEGTVGKKKAVKAGVEAASGDWIIQTDADCRLPATFISSHAEYAACKGLDLVAGPVVINYGKDIWSKIEALDYLGMTATGIAAFAAGNPVLCSAANMSYSKSFYLEVSDALEKIPHTSGDDMFLLSAAKKRNKGIIFLSGPEMVVRAKPAGGLFPFLGQRIRWGSKARFYTDRDMLELALLVGLANASMTTLLIFSFLKGHHAWIFAGALILKSIFEFLLLTAVARELRQTRLLRLFPVTALFYYFYITITGLLTMLGTFRWKGRMYS